LARKQTGRFERIRVAEVRHLKRGPTTVCQSQQDIDDTPAPVDVPRLSDGDVECSYGDRASRAFLSAQTLHPDQGRAAIHGNNP